MTMETDLNLNGKRLLNYNPKSKAIFLGNIKKEEGITTKIYSEWRGNLLCFRIRLYSKKSNFTCTST